MFVETERKKLRKNMKREVTKRSKDISSTSHITSHMTSYIKLLRKSINDPYRFEWLIGKFLLRLDKDNTVNGL